VNTFRLGELFISPLNESIIEGKLHLYENNLCEWVLQCGRVRRAMFKNFLVGKIS
jgi:hypothetical protein